jgi:D-alanyl-D-alanine carboxypeptidase/D-alanyl-D-alanine-endopeptidase (penicillin-binding protein 4)
LLVLGTVAAEAADPSRGRLRKTIEPVVARPELAAAYWGIEVRSLASGRTLYALNASKAFRPASALKLVTTAAALDAYGPDARIRTTLETAARLDSLGRILGDVYLVGRGDPNLSGRFSDGRHTIAFEAMAEALVAAGVRRIEGRLVGHEGAFASERRGAAWTWEDLAWGYGAEVSALSFADNLVEARLAPGERVGDPALLTLAPDTGCLSVVSTATTAEAPARPPAKAAVDDDEDGEITLLREPGSNDVRLTGALPLGGAWRSRLSVADPASCAAAVFASVLEARGIRVVSGVATSRAPLAQGARELAAYEGVPMAQMIQVVNTESQNLHAEMLLRLVGLKLAGEGSVSAGRRAVGDTMKRLGVDDEGWSLADGSGLARTDLLTPRGTLALLAAMDRHPHAAAFRDSLAVAGVSGTLEKRLRGTPAEKRLVGKTGTLQQANALAGYVTTTRGERLAFAIFVNNHAARGREATSAIDRIAALLAEAR